MSDDEKKQGKRKEKIQHFEKKEKQKKQVVSPEILEPEPKKDKKDS